MSSFYSTLLSFIVSSCLLLHLLLLQSCSLHPRHHASGLQRCGPDQSDGHQHPAAAWSPDQGNHSQKEETMMWQPSLFGPHR